MSHRSSKNTHILKNKTEMKSSYNILKRLWSDQKIKERNIKIIFRLLQHILYTMTSVHIFVCFRIKVCVFKSESVSVPIICFNGMNTQKNVFSFNIVNIRSIYIRALSLNGIYIHITMQKNNNKINIMLNVRNPILFILLMSVQKQHRKYYDERTFFTSFHRFFRMCLSCFLYSVFCS